MSILDPRVLKLGKLPARCDDRTLRLADYLPPVLPKPPASRDWTTPASPNWGMMLNDQLGDCAVAAPAHFLQAVTANVSAEVTIPDAAVLEAYKAISGYNGDPSTDTGCVLLDVLKYWRKVGIGGHKIVAFVAVNRRDPAELKIALNLFGGLIAGLELPVSCRRQKVWAVARGADGEPGSWGGHAVAVEAYTRARQTCITWGLKQPMTWGFWGDYADEAYAVLTPEWIAACGTSPSGFNLAQLEADLAAL